MKNYNQKINNFLNGLKDGENGDFRYIIPNRDTFELYRMENPEVEELTENEGKYLDILYKTTLLNGAAVGRIKTDIGKLGLSNDFGYVNNPKIEDDGPVDYITFDTTGLGEEAEDQIINHTDEDFENEAIKDLEHGKKL